MVQNVRKMIRSRSGNGAPASVLRGMASAAASATAPRMRCSRPPAWSAFQADGPEHPRTRRNSRSGRAMQGEHPRHAHHHHEPADQSSVGGQLRGGAPVDGLEHNGQLEADQHEQERVEKELEDLPDGGQLEAGGGGGQLRRLPAQPHADGHRGEHSRGPQLLGREIGGVGGEQGDGGLRGRRVVEPPPDCGDSHANHHADRDTAKARGEELRPGLRQGGSCR